MSEIGCRIERLSDRKPDFLVISLMLSISSRRFTLANKVPFFYFLDEATTFRIADFEKLPSVLREYLCSFVFLTQSAAKIEKIYGKYDRSSIESNFGNQFFGRTKDIEALKSYPLVFGKEERQRVSKTTGSSLGRGEPQPYSFHAERGNIRHEFLYQPEIGRVRGECGTFQHEELSFEV